MIRNAPIAYLVSRYPALSHTFIAQEIAGLRGLGMKIETFSIRSAEASDLIDERNRADFQTTTVLLSRKLRLITGVFREAILRPGRFWPTLGRAWRECPAGIVSKFMHFVYVMEAAELGHQMIRRGIRHVHVHFANNAASVALYATELYPQLKYSISIHGPTEFSNVDAHQLKLKTMKAAFVRCISHFCKSQVAVLLPPSEWPKLHVVHCGIDLHRFNAQARHRLSSPLRLFALGRLAPEKGFPVLLQSCAMLKKEGFSFNLRIGGTGPMREELQAMIKNADLEKDIELIGPINSNQVKTEMENTDVFALPSFQEGLPIVLMEAMASRRIVIANRLAGIPEMIRDGENGFITDPMDPLSFAKKIMALEADQSVLQSVAETARQTIQLQFNSELVCPQMRDLLMSYNPLKAES